MARKKTSTAEDLIALTARAPWYIGLALAAASYLYLHHVAKQPPPTPAAAPGQIGAMLTATLWRTLAEWGQYLLPLVFTLGAGLSAYRRHERRQLHADASGAKGAQAIDGMSWQQFEALVGEGFRRKGFSVAELGGQGPDGGVDLVLSKGSERTFVQCKQWRATKVGVTIVRELYGVMAAKGAAGGVVVTSGSFTDDAKAFASGRNIELMDGAKLMALLKSAQTPSKAPSRQEHRAAPEATSANVQAAPACPRCKVAMVRRQAKQGPNAGKQFWGCAHYPKCRGTIGG